jgi:Phage tail tube protein
MAAVIDSSVGLAAESTHKTFVAPSRHFEYNSESLKWTKNTKQGKGIRVGSRVARSNRRVIPTAEGAGDVVLDVTSKGMGMLWEAGFGSSTSTVVSGATYQQVHTFGDTLKSYSVQKGVVRANGTVDAYSFLGCVCSGFEIDSPNADLLSAKFSFDVADLTTAQSYTSPSYVSGLELLHFTQVTAAIGGTITAATTTALASSASPITVGVRDFNVSVTNNLDNKRFNYGNSGRKSTQIPLTREIKGKFTAEYDQTTLRDAFINDTDVSVLITASGSALSTGNVTFQVVLPVTRLDGDIPEASDKDLVTVEHSFAVLDGLSQGAMSLVTRTADTAL